MLLLTLTLCSCFLLDTTVWAIDDFEITGMTTCGEFKYKLANITSSTSSCFIKSSQPLRICQNCFAQFNYFKDNYELMNNGTIKYKQYPCSDSLLVADLSSTISDLYRAITVEWENINCDDCYKNGLLTDDFRKFLNLTEELMSCLQTYTNASLNFLSPEFETIWIDDSFDNTSCKICHNLYKELSKYYESLYRKMAESDDTNSNRLWGGLCGDMGDIMNTTQHLWSKHFRCDPRRSTFVQIVPLCTILVCTLLFYCLASTLCHNRVKTILYKQRRLKPVGSNGDEQSIQSMRSTF